LEPASVSGSFRLGDLMSDPGTFLLKLIVTAVMAAAISAALHATQAASPTGIPAPDIAGNAAVMSGTASEEGSCVLQRLLGFSC
jgi:hypothetical protein